MLVNGVIKHRVIFVSQGRKHENRSRLQLPPWWLVTATKGWGAETTFSSSVSDCFFREYEREEATFDLVCRSPGDQESRFKVSPSKRSSARVTIIDWSSILYRSVGKKAEITLVKYKGKLKKKKKRLVKKEFKRMVRTVKWLKVVGILMKNITLETLEYY